MKRAILLLIGLLLIAGIVVAVLYKPPTHIVHVNAVVLDEKRHPISFAVLSIANENGSSLQWYIPRPAIQPITGSTGYVQEEVPNPGTYVVEALASGYKNSQQTVNIKPGSPALVFVLQKE